VIGYGKLGRSMPLALERCGNLGGDVEMAAVVGDLARRHPEDHFLLVGRNDGSSPASVGLPDNVYNPWEEWGPELKRFMAKLRVDTDKAPLTVQTQRQIVAYLDYLTGDVFEDLDGMVMWVGQHGTTNSPLPSIQRPGQLTKPYDWSIYYASYMLNGINRWRDVDPWNREEVALNADPRNRHKMRDLKWPLRHPVLTQFNYVNNLKHARYGDPLAPVTEWRDSRARAGHELLAGGETLWTSRVTNTYARLEVNGLRPGTPFGDLISYNDDWDRPGDLGLFINEARAVGIRPELSRLAVFREYVAPLEPYFVHGTWSESSKKVLGRDIWPAAWDAYYPKLHEVRCTLTTPSSGSGWATAKPWEAFGAGTVCFFHPAYDTQDNILRDAPEALRQWLRVESAASLRTRVAHLSSAAGRADWEDLVRLQREHLDAALADLTYMKMTEERLYDE
jgi:hypothetical protein